MMSLEQEIGLSIGGSKPRLGPAMRKIQLAKAETKSSKGLDRRALRETRRLRDTANRVSIIRGPAFATGDDDDEIDVGRL